MQLRLGDLAREADAVAEGRGVTKDGLVRRSQPAEASRKHEPERDTVHHLAKTAQQKREVFVGFHIADEEHVGHAVRLHVRCGGGGP